MLISFGDYVPPSAFPGLFLRKCDYGAATNDIVKWVLETDSPDEMGLDMAHMKWAEYEINFKKIFQFLNKMGIELHDHGPPPPPGVFDEPPPPADEPDEFTEDGKKGGKKKGKDGGKGKKGDKGLRFRFFWTKSRTTRS